VLARVLSPQILASAPPAFAVSGYVVKKARFGSHLQATDIT
jgi:hypothetical protein